MNRYNIKLLISQFNLTIITDFYQANYLPTQFIYIKMDLLLNFNNSSLYQLDKIMVLKE